MLVECLIDAFFICDIVLNFRTAVMTPDGSLLADKKQIRKQYFRGWFLIDFTSCLPFGYIQYFNDAEQDGDSQAVRLIRLLRLIKLLRLARMKAIFDRWEDLLYLVSPISQFR
jgi:hypothetical protein